MKIRDESKKLLNVTIGDVCIHNVLIPSSDEKKMSYKLIAQKIVKKCGFRTNISDYPIPKKVREQKEMVPYYISCLAKQRRKAGLKKGMVF